MYLKLIYLLAVAWSVSSNPINSCHFNESEHWLNTLDRLHQDLTTDDQNKCNSCSFHFSSFIQPNQGSTYRQALNFVTNTTEVFSPWFGQNTVSQQIGNALESLEDELQRYPANCYQTGETHQDILDSFQCIREKSTSDMGCIMRHTLMTIKLMVKECIKA